jgi:hypothetical protein
MLIQYRKMIQLPRGMERSQPPPWLPDACPVKVAGPTTHLILTRCSSAPSPRNRDRSLSPPNRLIPHCTQRGATLTGRFDEASRPAAPGNPWRRRCSLYRRRAVARRDPWPAAASGAPSSWSPLACLSMLVMELVAVQEPRLCSTRDHVVCSRSGRVALRLISIPRGATCGHLEAC